MSIFARSNEEAILAVVTHELAALGVKAPCLLGEDEAARRGTPPRIVWIPVPKGRRYTAPTSAQVPGMKVAHNVNVAFNVYTWGANYFEASRLESALVAAMFNGFSPNAYELGEGGPAEAPETPGEGKGYELVIPVRLLRIPIPAELRPSVTTTGAAGAGVVEGYGGASPAVTGPSITIGG